MNRHTLTAVGVAGVALSAAMFGPVSPAQAASSGPAAQVASSAGLRQTWFRYYLGANRVSVDKTNSTADGYWTEVCDVEDDGDPVVAYFATAGYPVIVRDSYGGGCANRRMWDPVGVNLCEVGDIWDTCTGQLSLR